MTTRSKSLMSRIEEGVKEISKGDTLIYVEGDLAKKCEVDQTYLVPIVSTVDGWNVGILVRAHGAKDGRLYMYGDFVTPAEIREAVAAYWPKNIPIIVVCCHPKSVQAKYRKELKKNQIKVLYEDNDEIVWSSDNPYVSVSAYTDEAHRAIEQRRRM